MGAAFGCQAAASGCNVLLLHLRVYSIRYVKKKTVFEMKHKIIFLCQISICLNVFMFLGMLQSQHFNGIGF